MTKNSGTPQNFNCLRELMLHSKKIKCKIEDRQIDSLKKFKEELKTIFGGKKDEKNKIISFIYDYIVNKVSISNLKDEIRWIAISYYSIYEKEFLVNEYDVFKDKDEIKNFQKSLFPDFYLKEEEKTIAHLAHVDLKLDEPAILSIQKKNLKDTDKQKLRALGSNKGEIKIEFSDIEGILTQMRGSLEQSDNISKKFKEIEISRLKKFQKRVEKIYTSKPNFLQDVDVKNIYYGIALFYLVDPRWKQMSYFVMKFGEGVSNFGVNISFNRQLKKDEISKLKSIIFSLIKNLFFSIPLIEQKLRFNKSSTQTAVAAIMARNL
ncbi:MAG: hypothetical protein ACFFG0_42140, partial [Candidatus Thorarchaeota archaeon]